MSFVVMGEDYSFQPVASDSNGDPLVFAVTELPEWATFDPSTGRINGTPSEVHVGTYSGIRIVVSDGVLSDALGPFTISVLAAGQGAATLSWTPPAANTDGSALTDLAGYRVLYGRSAAALDRTIEIDNPSVSTCIVEGLSPGTWYFAVVAVNSRGATSVLSNMASKTIG